MKRLAFGVAIVLGILTLGTIALGLVFNNQANFSKNYVHDQLAEKNITFEPVAALLPTQKSVPCLIANAGKQLVSGKQAECYAKYQIGLDVATIDNGKTYFQDHYAAYLLSVKAQDALAKDPTSPATQALQKQSAILSAKAEAIFDGETMRGLLLTAYGFSSLGDRGATAATTCFVIAIVLALGAILGLVIGLRADRKRVPAEVPATTTSMAMA